MNAAVVPTIQYMSHVKHETCIQQAVEVWAVQAC